MVETLLEVRQLSKTFATAPAGFTVRRLRRLNRWSFTLRERQTLAIIGENGSGEIDPREDAGGHGGTHQRRTAD